MLKKFYVRLAIALLSLCLTGCGGSSRYQTIEEPRNWHHNYRPFKPGNRLTKITPEAAFRFEGEAPRMTGAYALYPVYAAAFQALVAEPSSRPNEYVDLDGSDLIFKKLNEEEADVSFCLRPAPGQVEEMRKAGLRYTLTPILREAFVFFVHKDNPATNLTQDQIRAIYSGKVKSWREVGVSLNARIAPYQRNKHSGSQTTLERIMGDTPIMEPPKEIYNKAVWNPIFGGSMVGIIRGVANSAAHGVKMLFSGFGSRLAEYQNKPAAIGFSFRFFANELIKNPNIKLLAIDGVAPTVANIQNGTYPFITEAYAITARPREVPFNSETYAITIPPRTGNVAKLIDFLRSPEGRRMIENTGYTPTPEGSEDTVLE